MEIDQKQTHRIQKNIQNEGNLSETPVKMCLISNFPEAQYPLLAGLLQISIILVCFYDKADGC